jgi:hypothetical protein
MTIEELRVELLQGAQHAERRPAVVIVGALSIQ